MAHRTGTAFSVAAGRSARIAVAVVTAAGLVTAGPAALAASARPGPVVPHAKSVPVFPVVSHYRRAVAERSWRVPAPGWPSGRGVARIPVAGTAGRAAAAAVRAGSLPVWVQGARPAAGPDDPGGSAATSAV